MCNSKSKAKTNSSRRRGAALPEAAVCLPLLTFFVFSMAQLVNMVYLRQKLTSACYVGMQELAQQGSNESQIIDNVRSILEARSVVASTVEILPEGVLDTASMGEEFSIRITAPMSQNLPGPVLLPVGGTMTVTQHIYR